MRSLKPPCHQWVRSLLVLWCASAVLLASSSAFAQSPPVQIAPAGTAATSLPSPEEFFGFRMGTDGRLAGWPAMLRYFDTLGRSSDRVRVLDLGLTTMKNRYIAAVISSAPNMRRLEEYRTIIRRLEDPRTLDASTARTLIADGKVVIAIGCSIHAEEIGATQAANELAYRLATEDDPRTREILDNVIFILFPSLNPDGHVLVTDWNERTRGTPYEGASMPWLYHKYVGHDINRDTFMLNQVENRLMAHFWYTDWHPQVFLTMHQMGQHGPRLFVPPNFDPIDPNYDPLIWREAGLFGHAMATALEAEAKSGVINNAMYDYFWPGYEDSEPLGHNTVCLLTEAASARLSQPIYVAPGELQGGIKGLPEYKIQENFPNPWPGGWWRLRNIVDYEITAAYALLESAARYRATILANFYEMGRRAVERGRQGSPFAFVVAPDQRDPQAAADMLNLLVNAGVEVHRATAPTTADGKTYAAGTYVVLMAQPYRAYAKTLLEKQVYPERRLYTGGPPERPYDVTAWTLPLQMGVETVTIDRPFQPVVERVTHVTVPPGRITAKVTRGSVYLVPYESNNAVRALNGLLKEGARVSWLAAPLSVPGRTYAPGTLIVESDRAAERAVPALARDLGLMIDVVAIPARTPRFMLSAPRIGLYKPWVANIDEGWTRWLLEKYGFTFENIMDSQVRAGNLRLRFDAIILPNMAAERIVEGHRPGTMPPDYVGGIGTEGTENLKRFVEEGGSLVCLDSSGQLAIDALGLGVRNVLKGVKPEEFFCPGSILRLHADPDQPLAYGIPSESIAFFSSSAAYETTPAPATSTAGHTGDSSTALGPVTVAATYPAGNLLLSGWIAGERMLGGRAAIVEAPVGAGRAVLLGFRVQHRAQPEATFKYLFNALYLAIAKPARH